MKKNKCKPSRGEGTFWEDPSSEEKKRESRRERRVSHKEPKCQSTDWTCRVQGSGSRSRGILGHLKNRWVSHIQVCKHITGQNNAVCCDLRFNPFSGIFYLILFDSSFIFLIFSSNDSLIMNDFHHEWWRKCGEVYLPASNWNFFYMPINMFVILLLIRLSLKLSSNLDNSQMWKKKKMFCLKRD